MNTHHPYNENEKILHFNQSAKIVYLLTRHPKEKLTDCLDYGPINRQVRAYLYKYTLKNDNRNHLISTVIITLSPSFRLVSIMTDVTSSCQIILQKSTTVFFFGPVFRKIGLNEHINTKYVNNIYFFILFFVHLFHLFNIILFTKKCEHI